MVYVHLIMEQLNRKYANYFYTTGSILTPDMGGQFHFVNSNQLHGANLNLSIPFLPIPTTD